ncbi:MAG: cupin domain-containing protein [Candidatus Woesearchaeota archaeon]
MKLSSKDLSSLIKFENGGITSKVISKSKNNSVTLMCMAKGTSLEPHTSTKLASLVVLCGSGTFNLYGRSIPIRQFSFIAMPKNALHSVKAKENLAFLLFLTG